MLRSAAAACDGRVLVAMLTGMGQDGLAGTRRVIEAGGTAVAQDEATSVVWGMPGAVAQAGLCHAVLPLPRIAPKLLELLRMRSAHEPGTVVRRVRSTFADAAEEPLRPGDRPGQALSAGDAAGADPEARAAARSERHWPSGCVAPGAEALVREVVEAMTTNESFFFRDDKPFQHFRTQALPRLLAARAAGTPLRIWSAASSSGQEAYSLAMILSECRASIGDRRIEIIGTDIAREQVARARDGLYTQFEVQRGLPVQMLMRYFRKEADRLADQRCDPRAWCSSANGTCWPICGRSGSSTSCSAATC